MLSKMESMTYVRPIAEVLAGRLVEPRRFIQVVAGPRQVGKTTLVRQVLGQLDLPAAYASADEPTLRGPEWLAEQWDAIRLKAHDAGPGGAVLALDEIHKVPGWSETVKRLWDEDTADGLELRLVVLGSAPLLVQRGLGESLTGRFELIHLPHWSFAEMRDAFGFDIDRYLWFGGYPGPAVLAEDPVRWTRYVLDSIIETTLARDVLLLSRIDKPALLRRLFDLACRYSGQVLSYHKMLGQLQDAGNTTTLAHYLDLLAGAGMVAGIGKYSGSRVRQRASSPKLTVLNTGLLAATSGLLPDDAAADPGFRGRLAESAVGAQLANAAASRECEVFYWRERNREVDFVVKTGPRLTAIEVKTARRAESLPGMAAFMREHRPHRRLLVGTGGIPLEEFLGQPVTYWTA
ncbi:MAG: ATP-binding protein [candidate division WOR-3 bacterium]|nr:MAG: ATP-binding protein [candidate division WOR-3 bacterium]